jgi:hypothetical protein
MAPADVSRFTELAFAARGDGKTYRVLLFAERFGFMPVARTFVAGADWEEHVVPLSEFSGFDGRGLTGLLFSAGPAEGAFTFDLDEVELRPALPR